MQIFKVFIKKHTVYKTDFMEHIDRPVSDH